MSENQKDQQVTGNQGGQQNQGGQSNRDNQRKEGAPTEKSSTVIEEDEEPTDTLNELPGKNQQNGEKAPSDERNRQKEHQGESTVRNASKDESSNKGGNQNQNANQRTDKKG